MTFNVQPLPPKNIEESKPVLRKLALAHRYLAELKGVAEIIPNQSILINTLSLQEAKDSSAIENIITTHDELYKAELFNETFTDPAAKEVSRYANALKLGFNLVEKNHILTINHILEIQSVLEQNDAGFRKIPGTVLLNQKNGEIVYKPPQDYETIRLLMENLAEYINDKEMDKIDPLVKMAVIHYQFETIHPFYDGNGRAGRIINILYLILENLLSLPILYLSRYIIQNKAEYYRQLQNVRETGEWEPWLLYMLDAIEKTSQETIVLIHEISRLMLDYKHRIRASHPKIYSQDLINNLFKHPYTKIDFLSEDLSISRLTATKYLNILVREGFLTKQKIWRTNYFVNLPLFELLKGGSIAIDPNPMIITRHSDHV